MGTFLVQSRHGRRGNFEVVVPSSHGGGLVHLWRNNDDTAMPWSGPTCFGGRSRYVGTSFIQGNYGDPGNLEVVATGADGNLDFFWRQDRTPWTWSGPQRVTAGVTGTPAIIQSRHGRRGNFEVVVGHRDGGLVHTARANDAGGAWNTAARFGGRARYVGATLIQSNYGNPGNLEVLATDSDGNLDFFWRIDRAPWTWSGPHRIASGVRGAPALIQSRHGTRGNFEAVVGHRDGGLVHLWRNNDVGSMPWSAPGRFGGAARYAGVALVQGNYGSPGNLEVVGRDDAGNLDFFWRLDRAPWTWSGPGRIGTEVSFDMKECTYDWTAAYRQADTHVTVRIHLVPDAGISAATMNGLRTTWRDGIIDTWSDRFDCRGANGERKRLTFDVVWTDQNPHHTVQVRPGPDHSNMTTWDTADDGPTAAHEFGHMLGHPDEYSASACPSRSPVGTGTVMDDKTETVARLYHRITAGHCGHTPAAVATLARPALDSELIVRLRDIDLLRPPERTDALGALRRVAHGDATPSEAGEAQVSLEISGGAPGERYEYRVAVGGGGEAERYLLDELRSAETEEGRATISDDEAATVFAAAESVGLLDDDVPSVPQEASGLRIPPDSLVVTVTVREGDAVRRVTVPAVEPGPSGALGPVAGQGVLPDEVGTPPESTEMPLATDVQIPRESARMLSPLLDALAVVERGM